MHYRPTISGTINNSGGECFAPSSDIILRNNIPGLKRNRDPMILRLIRNAATGLPPEGIYTCVIKDDTFAEHTVYVGIYNRQEGMHNSLT